MTDSTKKVEYAITGDASQFVAAMERAAAATTGASAAIRTQFESVGNAFAAVQRQLLMLTAVIAGGAFFKEAIDASLQLTREVGSLARRLNLTAEQASALNTALGDIGSDSETYLGAFDKFAKQLKTNEDGLQAMGLQTRDSKGELRDSNTVFMEALQIVGQYRPGLDQTTAAMTLFGKSVDEVMGLQRLNNGLIEEARQKNEALGLTITRQNVEASRKYRAAMNDVGDVLLAVKKAVGDAVMPVFAELGEYFARSGPLLVDVFKGALTGLLLVLRGVQAAVRTLVAVIIETVSTVVDQVGNLAALLAAVMRGDFSEAARVWETMGQRFGQAIRGVADETRDAFSQAQQDFGGDAQRTWRTLEKGSDLQAPKGGNRTMGSFEPGKKDSRMQGWEATLEERKLALAETARAEGTFREMSRQEELAYWQHIRDTTTLSKDELIAIRKKIATTGLEINKGEFDARLETLRTEREALGKNYAERSQLAARAYQETVARYGEESKEARKAYAEVLAEHQRFVEQQRALDLSATEARRARQAADIELQRVAAQQDLQLGLLTQAQALEHERQFEEQLYAIRLEALQERLALIDPERDPLAYEQASRQIEAAALQHRQRLAQIRSQATVESQADVTRTLGAIESSWSGLIAKLMQGSLTIGNFIRGMFQSVAQAVINTVAQIGARWLIEQITTRLLGKATAAGQVQANAGVAGSAAVASTAAIPVVGPALAPAAGATAFATAMGFLPAVLASAEGGYDIPGSLNPVVQLHQREMVLPAKHADVIRELAENGRGAGGRADPAPVVLRGASAGEFFIAHRRELAQVLKDLGRDFVK